jgi:phosphoenolpyruvate-protein kinase (PTS system EI component)
VRRSHSSESPTLQPKSQKWKASPSNDDDDFNTSAKAILASIQARKTAPQQDNLDVFAQLVASKLKMIKDPKILRTLKRKIQADIAEAQD